MATHSSLLKFTIKPCLSFFQAYAYGDPHITSLDGHKYTFNGRGEFVLIETDDQSFTLQARMVPIISSTSDTPKATVFTAILARELYSDTVQFEIINKQIAVIVSGTKVDFSSINEHVFTNVTVTNLGNDTFSVIFSSGAYLEVREENEIFSILIVNLPQEFKEKNTRGLMGSFNGNTSDDLLPRLGQVPLSLNASLREIHEQFGLTCKFNIQVL